MGTIGVTLGFAPQRFEHTDLPGQIATGAYAFGTWYFGIIALRTQTYSYEALLSLTLSASAVDIGDTILAKHGHPFLSMGFLGDLKPVVRATVLLAASAATYTGLKPTEWLLPPITLAWTLRESLVQP